MPFHFSTFDNMLEVISCCKNEIQYFCGLVIHLTPNLLKTKRTSLHQKIRIHQLCEKNCQRSTPTTISERAKMFSGGDVIQVYVVTL